MKKLMVVLLVVCAGVVSAGSLDNPTNVFEHFPNVNVDAHMLKIAQWHFQDIREGTVPAGTNELARARQIPLLDWNHATPQQIAGWFRRTLHAWAIGGSPEKEWRVSNKIDIWRWAAFRSDAFWTSQHLGERDSEMNPLIAGLRRLDLDSQWNYQDGFEKKRDGTKDWERPHYTYVVPTNSYEILKQVCALDDCARDVIVGIGLVCRDLPLAKELAMEFARESEVNWPVYALRIPYADAAKLLVGKPEYARLLSNLAIQEMKPGLKRYKAIRAHLARFPDYTVADMPKTSIALNTHAELAAVAGVDLVNSGDWMSAIELWLTHGACPEDVALVAEQLLSIADLKGLCERFPVGPARYPHPRMKRPWSVYCSHNGGSGRYLIVEDGRTLRRYVRTILAKRLMRAGRGKEAVEWFDESRDIILAQRYLQVKTIAEHGPTNVMRRFNAYMTLGALMRQGADRLFGTELEPDNMICGGQYACEWAKHNEALKGKRKIDETRRFHYRWRTADVDSRAETLLNDKMPDCHLRDADNWLGDDPLVVFTNEMFKPRAVELPPYPDNAKDLLRIGEELFDAADQTGGLSNEGYAAALYAFYLAGQKGSALGYERCCAYFIDQIGDYTLAIPFIKAAMRIDANLPTVRYYYARILCEIGMRNDAFKIVQSIADYDCADRKTELFALGLLCKYYEDGLFRNLMAKEVFNRYHERYRQLDSRLNKERY